jgi:penicillin amidase
MGYACAQDRLFQLEYDRRRACGRWAEIAGSAALGGDVLARRLGLAAAAQLDLEVMSPPVLAAFEAYASGVNQAVADGALPLPARYQVEPWLAWHSVAAFLVRHVQMGQWQHKLANAVLLARAGADAFERLETRPVPGSPVAVPPDGRLTHQVAGLLDEALAEVEGHLGFVAEVEPGSNAWAVSGRRTAHGGAVICNDSHRALDSPNVYWQCRVSCPDFDVTGATFPGLPGFPHFGFNGSVAWAITHGDADTQDLYLERFEGTRYLTASGWAQAEVRHERIGVRGGSPVTVPVWVTRHGPVVHGNPEAGLALVLKWTGTHRPNRGFECLLPMLTARTAAQLAVAQDGWVDPVNNLVCADTSGDIAYQCRGELPVRSSDAARRLPAPGWDDACEWTGTVPFASLPRDVAPEAGFVMTANNVVTEADEPYISYTFSQPWRAERLRSLLAGTPVHSVDELAGMQADTVSLKARGWGQLLPGLGPFKDPDAETARALLAGWDGNLAAGSAEALLYACFQRALAQALYRPVLGARTWAWMTSGALAPTLTMIRRWLGNDTWELLGGPVPPEAVSEASSRERRERVLAAVPAALAGAWAAAVKAGGPDPGQWRWGDAHQAVRVHPLAGPFPGVPMGGDSDTIQASGYGWRLGSPFTVVSLSVYRQVVDLADPGAASFAVPGGASGDPASAHFSDQLALWAGHRRIPMRPEQDGAELEHDDFRADREVLVVVVRVRVREVHAAVRPRGQAAAVERDAARREERRPRHRLVVDIANERRAGLPLDPEGAARSLVRAAGLARLHLDRPERDLALVLEPGDVPGQVHARGRGGRAVPVVGVGQRQRSGGGTAGRRVRRVGRVDPGRVDPHRVGGAARAGPAGERGGRVHPGGGQGRGRGRSLRGLASRLVRRHADDDPRHREQGDHRRRRIEPGRAAHVTTSAQSVTVLAPDPLPTVSTSKRVYTGNRRNAGLSPDAARPVWAMNTLCAWRCSWIG